MWFLLRKFWRNIEVSKSCPLASIEASTPVVSLTELIAATKAPLASPSL